MLISFSTSAGSSAPNEDAVAASASIVAVVDGVSAPAGMDTGCTHGTSWYSRSLASQIIAIASEMCDFSLRDTLASAIESIARTHAHTCDLSCNGTPSATVAIVRATATILDYLVLSDSTIIIEQKQSFDVIADKRVDELLKPLIHAAKSSKPGTDEHASRIGDLVSAQRKLRNVEGGYWLAGSIPAAADHAITGSAPLGEVCSVALMTDGASSLVDAYGSIGWRGGITILKKEGPEEWISRVRQVESSDPEGVRWPRYKISDDATVALCMFEHNA